MEDPLGHKRPIPVIPQPLYEQLMRVEPSIDRNLKYRPCRVYLKDGRVQDHVYVMEALSWVSIWGIWPEDDRGKNALSIEDVVRIEESTLRLPARIADKIYEAGESGMGYFLFTLVLEGGRKLVYATGDAVDFLAFPPDVTPDMIADVLPHEGRGKETYGEGAPYYWCLYLEPGHEVLDYDLIYDDWVKLADQEKRRIIDSNPFFSKAIIQQACEEFKKLYGKQKGVDLILDGQYQGRRQILVDVRKGSRVTLPEMFQGFPVMLVQTHH